NFEAPGPSAARAVPDRAATLVMPMATGNRGANGTAPVAAATLLRNPRRPIFASMLLLIEFSRSARAYLFEIRTLMRSLALDRVSPSCRGSFGQSRQYNRYASGSDSGGKQN